MLTASLFHLGSGGGYLQNPTHDEPMLHCFK